MKRVCISRLGQVVLPKVKLLNGSRRRNPTQVRLSNNFLSRTAMASEQKVEFTVEEIKSMSEKERENLEERVQAGETVVKGGYGGKSLEAQMHLSEGRHKGGYARAEELGHEGYQEMGRHGGEARREQMGREGYQEMGRKGGLSTMEQSGAEAAEEKGVEIDESKYRTK